MNKQLLERILKVCSKILIILAVPTLLILRTVIGQQLLDSEAVAFQKEVEAYEAYITAEVENSIPLMNQIGIMISERKINMTDAYSILTTSDPQTAWSIYTTLSDEIIGEGNVGIEPTGELKVKTDGIYGEVLSLCVQKTVTPACLVALPDNVFIIDTETHKYFTPKHDAQGYMRNVSIVNPSFGTYPDSARVFGEDVYYVEAPVTGTNLIVRYFKTKEELKETYKQTSFILNLIVTIFTILIIYFGIHLYLESNKISKSEKIRQEKEAAEKANLTKNLFLANMSHEIRTPLNSILGLNELILRESKEELIREYAVNVKTAGSNLLSLINDILDFTKIEQGRLALIEAPFSLSKTLTELYTVFKYKADEKGLLFDFKISPDIPEHLKGDSIRLEQVLSNLLSNAIKYTDKGKVTFSLTWLETRDSMIDLIARVEDTGRGIKEESQKEIFNKFTRVDMVANKSIEGTGLGLAITKEIVDAMGGHINVESIYGSGSIFTVSIPQKVYLMKPIGKFVPVTEEKADDVIEDLYAPEARVLIVDDTVLNLKVTKKLLEPTGMTIDTAESGLECISLMEQNFYNIVFMDDRMPQMDGTETLQRLKTLSNVKENLESGKTKVIMMTANVISGAREKYVENGFVDYLPKPVASNTLYHTIKLYLPNEYIKERPVEVETETTDTDYATKLSKVEGLDINQGIDICGDMTTYIEALEEFTNSSMDFIKEVQSYMDAGDIEDCTIKFHSLKSTAKLIGAKELSQEALKLEEAGNKNNVDYIHQNAGKALRDYGQLSVKIQTALTSPEVLEEGEEIDINALQNIFSHMYSYVVDFNDEALTSMVKALSHYKFPPPYDNAFKVIKNCQKKADWEGLFEEFETLGFTEEV